MRFVLVDEILELCPGRSVRAVTSLSPEEELFRDHFPGFPVVPGVLLTEMMGQAAAKCLVAEGPERGVPVLAQIRSAVFRDWVRPGEPITLSAEIGSSRDKFATASCRAEVNGRPVCTAELMFAFLPRTSVESGYSDGVLERFLARRAGGSAGGTPPSPAPAGGG